MLAFDLETTGVDVEVDRIVTASAVAANPPEKSAIPTNWLLNPGIDIPEEASAVHGITTEKAIAEGADSATAVAEIAANLIDAWEADVPVVAFNAAYDLTLLDREMRRHGIGRLIVAGPVIDPSVIDRALDSYRKGKRSLAAVCAHYGVTQTGAHSSEGDALATARLAWKMPRAFPDLADIDLIELHDKQVQWRKEWAVNFEAYLRSKGEDTTVNGEWPMRSFYEAVS